MAVFNGQLRHNEIFGAIYNMKIKIKEFNLFEFPF